MKRASLTAILAMLLSAPLAAHAQAGKTGAPQQEAAVKAEPAAPKLVVTERRPRRADVDARHCLKLATNREIHRCAEKYR